MLFSIYLFLFVLYEGSELSMPLSFYAKVGHKRWWHGMCLWVCVCHMQFSVWLEVSECVCVAVSGRRRRTRHLGAQDNRRRRSSVGERLGEWIGTATGNETINSAENEFLSLCYFNLFKPLGKFFFQENIRFWGGILKGCGLNIFRDKAILWWVSEYLTKYFVCWQSILSKDKALSFIISAKWTRSAPTTTPSSSPWQSRLSPYIHSKVINAHKCYSDWILRYLPFPGVK